MSRSEYSVLVIGLDGATFDLLLPWAGAGLLPNLSRLLDEGVSCRLRSTTPPITPCAWSSFMTGMNPGKHGLFDFVAPNAEGHGFHFTNALSRSGETLWGYLSRHDRQVGVVNVPMTYPPEPVNGYLISGLDTPHEHSEYTYPKSLRGDLHAEGIRYRVDLRHLGDMRTDARRDLRLRELHEMETIRSDAFRLLRQRHAADFEMIVYIATDQAQHHFWHYMDESHDKHDPVGAQRYRHVIRDVYVHLDRLIGEILDEVSDDTVVVVMSDHGFGPTTNVRLRLNQLLADAGLLQFRQPTNARRAGNGSWSGRLEKWLRAGLSPTLKSWLAATFPRLRVWAEGLGGPAIDWSQTQAYVNEIYRASPAVWLNSAGRTTSTDAISDGELLKQICDLLLNVVDPETGRRVISEVVNTSEIFQGPHAASAPELLLSWWEDGFLLEPSNPADGSIVERCHKPVVGGVEFTGSHRMDGVLIMHGPPIRRGHKLQQAQIIDLAPTILHVMGFAVPRNMDGSVLFDALEPEFRAARQPEFDDQERAPTPAEATASPTMSKEDELLVARRLEALGYLDPGSGGAGPRD